MNLNLNLKFAQEKYSFPKGEKIFCLVLEIYLAWCNLKMFFSTLLGLKCTVRKRERIRESIKYIQTKSRAQSYPWEPPYGAHLGTGK